MTADAVQWGSFEIAGPRHEYRESLLVGLVARAVGPGATVLDAGCGGGSLAVALAGCGYRVIGVESSSECVTRARRRVQQSGLAGRVSIHRADVTALPLANASVDAVVSGEVLEHVADDAAAVSEYRRVLRPGGACIVSVPAHPALWDVTDEWAGHVRRYRRRDLIELFAGQGFAVHRVRAWGFPTVLLYHRLLFLPWARRSGGLGGAAGSSHSRSALRRAATALLGGVFRVDGLFSRFPVGWGWLLTARAPRA